MAASLISQEHVKAIVEEKDLDFVFDSLSCIPDDKLEEKDPVTGASLVFIAVQRKNDAEALRVLKYLVDERQVCAADLIDYNQQSAIFFAARDGNVECVKYLVGKGCDPTYKDSAGQTCLFYACRDGRDAIVSLLVSPAMGVDINDADKIGQTALFYAAREGRRATVDLLLKLGADAALRDWQKKCAHTYAQRKGHLELAAHLKGACAVTQDGREHVVISKGKKRGAPVEIRHKCRLQHVIQLESGNTWLFTHPEKTREFEELFPNVAAWSHMTQTSYNAADAFRMEWAREALQIVHIVSNYKDGWLFTKPVDTKAWNCPDYYTIITEPRDFQLIRRKLRNLEYWSLRTFARDVELVFLNCFRYNSETSEVHKAGKRVQAFCRSVFEERNISHWVEREDELVEYLRDHDLPVTIGVEGELKAAEEMNATESTDPSEDVNMAPPNPDPNPNPDPDPNPNPDPAAPLDEEDEEDEDEEEGGAAIEETGDLDS